MTPSEMLDLKFMSHDLHREITIRGYMQELLYKLFEEGESFSGKRPFGNSGWEYDIAVPLIRAGVIGGNLDRDEIDEIDYPAFDKTVRLLIEAL